MFTLMLLRVIGSSITTITPCHSEIRETKMTKPFQVFSSNLSNSQKKSLSLQG